MSLSLDTARTLVAGTLATAAERGLKPLAVAVLDQAGLVIAAERQDGTSARRLDIAHGKGHGAIALGMGSRAIQARAEQQPYFVSAATAAVGGALIPVAGGVLVKDANGTVLGAIGVSGDTSDNDEAAAVAAIEAAGLVAQVD
ncbi:GlcG/HbpS family heme-binding protein [Georgenia sp. Z1344]|uniref:GlcG/HbpS family heme-binding protein n=1 Tax=Georgenia sp. Z1344 TaxID=3416706 RepID=UPI003CEC02E6